MFGYVRAYKPELKVRDYEIYKAVYCTLCRKLGRSYGLFARLTLSYDFTFLALIHSGLKETCGGFDKRRCAFNPFKKCSYCKDDQDFELPSAAAMIMLYYKILDNIADNRGIKRLFYKLVLPIFNMARKKAEQKYPQIARVVGSYIDNQTIVEKQYSGNLDLASEPTAAALSQIFAMCGDTKDKRQLERLGYCIGKWVYLLDAAADLETDIKRGNFNPLAFEYNRETDPLYYAKLKIEPVLNVCISEAAKAFELLDVKKYKSILENIIYLGLKNSQMYIFKKESFNERPL